MRNPRTLLGMAGACAFAFCVLLVIAYASHRARSFDVAALRGFLDLQGKHLGPLARFMTNLGDPVPVIVITAFLAAVSAARGRLRQAAAIVFLVGVTSVSGQALKALLAYPREGALVSGAHLFPAAFPSGHSTAAMALAACGVMAAPRAVRPAAAALGALLALGVGYSVVTLGWHYPSDVVGGFLLASFWALIAVAGLQASEQRWPQRVGRTRARAAAAGIVERVTEAGLTALAIAAVVVLGGGLLIAALTRRGTLVDFASAHLPAVVVGLAVATSVALLLAGVTAALGRRK